MLKRCLAPMMSMFCSTAMMISPEIGAQARRTCVHRLNAAGGSWARDCSDSPVSASTWIFSRHPQNRHIADERHRRAPVGAGDAGAGGRQRHARDQPNGLLADQADADALVVADPLQHAAQHRQLQPQPGGGQSERPRPRGRA